MESAAEIGQLRQVRDKKIRISVSVGLIAQCVGYATRLAMVPMSISLLGVERYGLWLTVSSLIAWLRLSDLGISSGLVYAFASSFGKNDTAQMRRLVSSGLASLACAGLLVLAISIGFAFHPALRMLIGIGQEPSLWRDAARMVMICGASLAISLPLSTVTAVATALQEGYLVSAANMVGNLALLGTLAALVAGNFNDLSIFSVGMNLPPLAASAILAIYLISRHRELTPSLRHCTLGASKTIGLLGGPLLVSQFGDFVVFYGANILIANQLGIGHVPSFAVPFAMFMAVRAVTYTITAPNLPAYLEALHRGDWEWIRGTARRAMLLANSITLGSNVIFCFFGKGIIKLWSRSAIEPETEFLIWMAVFFQVLASATTAGILLIGLGRAHTKAALQVLTVVSFVACAFVIVPRFGVLGVCMAGTVAYSLELMISIPCALHWSGERFSPR